MSKEINNTTIICPLFQKYQELLISKKNSIKNSVRPIEKVIFAEEISETTDRMLECNKFDKHQLDCSSCHAIAETQKKLAEAQFASRKSA